MEAEEIARRIRQIHDVQTAMDESGEGRIPLSDNIRNAISFMTPEEIKETLLRVLDKLDAEHEERLAGDEQRRKEKEAHDLEIATLKAKHKAEIAEKDSEIAEKDKQIREDGKEIEGLKKALEDEKNRNKTNTRNTYGSKSRRSRTAVGGATETPNRAMDKEAFDAATPDKGTQALQPVDTTAEGDKVMTEEEVDAHNARIGMKYTMADADTKVVYPCNRDAIPQGWVLADEKPIIKTIFDTRTIVTARQIEFVRIKRKVEFPEDDGSLSYKWEYRTMHFPLDGETLAEDTGIAGNAQDKELKPYDTANIPGKLGNTSSTPAMAAQIIMDHFLCFIPINRISAVFKEYGFNKCRQGIIDWVLGYAGLLRPAYLKLMDTVFKDDAVLFMDETWKRLHLNNLDRKVYEWIIGNKKEKCIVYYYDDGSRGRKVISDLLEGRNIKAIHTDGYNAYFFLEDLGIIHIACTAHIWRYIMDWYNATQDEDARMLLLAISALYASETRIRGKSPAEILAERQSDEVTNILTNYKARLDVLNLKIDSLPQVGQSAVSYALKFYPNMARWREDADFELDNNFAERAARPVAMSRKMQLHHASHKGAEASCIIRSVIETCKLWGVSVYEYLKAYFCAIAAGRTDYDNLMPWSIRIGC